MAHCPQCAQLVGASSTVPEHQDLEYLGADPYKTVGWRSGTLRHYRCKACGTRWHRDVDKTDPWAIWAEDSGS